jgi:hypothetical protein
MIQSGFYAWAIVALAMVFYLLNYTGQGKKWLAPYAILVTVWIAYVAGISYSGILADFSLPPRVPLLIVVPAVMACFIFTGARRFKEVLRQTPLHMPIYFQSFRIVVEFLIFGAFLEGVFPERATFLGLNFDVLAGISAPVTAYLYQRKIINVKGLLGWNFLSMVILIVTVYSFISTYYFTDYVARGGNSDFTKMPYLLLASVLLPVAVFLHIFSLRQIVILRDRTIQKSATSYQGKDVVL